MNSMKAGVLLSVLLSAALVSCDIFDNNSGAPVNEDIWVNAYLLSWQHNPETEQINSGIMKTVDIDWDAMTHLTYFSLEISEDGTPAFSLDPVFRNNFNSDRLQAITTAAHANDTKILFSVGGANNYEGFSGAIDSSREIFINTIVNIIREYGFDGVSLNMTPIEPGDFINYRSFVRGLSATFDTLKTNQNNRPLLTAGATKEEGIRSLYEDIQHHFDQINVLTYNMAQPWRGWLAWHNSALYNNEIVFENDITQRFPSVDGKVNEWLSSGVERGKLGIAVNFYGSVWEEVQFLEKWPVWPTEDMSVFNLETYTDLNRNYDLSGYQWDEKARVPYLNLSNPKSFISFDNERSISEKIEYAKRNRLGGVMIWDLSAGFSQDLSPKDPLLKFVKSHLNK